tara:strand:+ start:415 stop:1230 length:816 start_codon:yes stop_codon:yes gene_type:complete
MLNDTEINELKEKGYFLKKSLFDKNEINSISEAFDSDENMKKHANGYTDEDGKAVTHTLWNHPKDDIFGAFARSERVVNTLEKFFDQEIYHYHSKIIWKRPGDGAFNWHQDYGYWYRNGCLFPDMASCTISIDASTSENGCLQFLEGSHKLGRIEHMVVNQQEQADPQRVEEAKKVLDHKYLITEPGDALFFHSNLLHRSDANNSDKSRRSLICCYNTKNNNPYKEHHHPRYTPLIKVPDNEVMDYTNKTTNSDEHFLRKDNVDQDWAKNK